MNYPPRQSNFKDVLDFHLKFRVPIADRPSLLDADAQQFREKFLMEEYTEFVESYRQEDLEGCADALVDLVYIAMGTAVIMGLPWQELWDRVQAANMTKRLAKPDGSDSKRGNPLDVVKPPGWVGPNHTDLLGLTVAGKWPTFDATTAVQLLAQSVRTST